MDDIEANRWRRLRPLLDRAVELEGDARRAFLDDLRGDDADLRDTLERLLARHSDLRDSTLSTAAALVVLSLAEGDRFNAYRRRAPIAVACRASGVCESEDRTDGCLINRWLSKARFATGG